MCEFFSNLVISDVIQIIGVIVSAGAVFFTYRNLKEIKNQFFQQNKGNIIFYIDVFNKKVFHSLIIKNFGISPARLISIKLNPDLDWSKTKVRIPNEFNFNNYKDILLAPGQYVMSEFDFSDYPDQEFEVELKYETCGKTFTENYKINLNFASHMIETNSSIKDEFEALKEINKSIQQLSDKFL